MTPPPSDKRADILRAAERVFLKKGYDRTSMLEVARAAGASKQTVYNHFVDKEALFVDVIKRAQSTVAAQQDALASMVDDEQDIVRSLEAMAHRMLIASLDPTLAALRRVMSAEVAHHPRLRAHWSNGAPLAFFQALVELLERAHDRRQLSVPAAPRAALQLMAILGQEAQGRSAFGARSLDDDEQREIVHENVAMFVRAYRRFSVSARASDSAE
jgi:AcrR family transcriptional regulator